MKANQLLSIIFLFFATSVNTTTTVDEEHEKFSNEYHSVIRQSLSLVSSTFEGLDYDIKDGKFSMSWSHGSIPTLDFSFAVIFQNEQVCKIDFIIDTFLAHVPEKLKDDSSNEQIDAIKKQITQCSQTVVSKLSGPSELLMNEEVLREGSELLNQSDLNSDEQDEVKRMIILDEPVQYQQIWLDEPVTAVHTIEKVINFVKQKSDLSSEERGQLAQRIIENPKIDAAFEQLSSESQKREMSDNQSQRFEDSSEEESPQLNKYQNHANRGIFFISSSVEVTISQQVSSEEDQNQTTPNKNMVQDFMNWIHQLRPSLFNTLNYDQIFNIDSSDEESFDSELYSNSSERNQNSSEKKVQKNDNQTQTENGLVDNEQDYTCQVIDKKMVKEKLRQLHLENQIQDVKVFDENIVKCKRGKGLKIDVILSFNLEQCYLGLEGTLASGYKMLSTFDSQNFGIPLNDSIKNCVDRLGTQALKTRRN